MKRVNCYVTALLEGILEIWVGVLPGTRRDEDALNICKIWAATGGSSSTRHPVGDVPPNIVHNCTHMGTPNKGETQSKSGEFEGAFGAVPRWLKKFIIHDVSGSVRGSSLLRLSRSEDNEAPRITASCIRVAWDAAATATVYANVLGPFLKMATTIEMMTICVRWKFVLFFGDRR